jgi:hypothetical protein
MRWPQDAEIEGCGDRHKIERGGVIPPLSIIPMEKTRIFVSKHCGPCQVIKDMVQNGQVDDKDVELIDVETDEGFPYIAEFGLTGVPSAYRGKQKCEIKIDQDILQIICDDTREAPPSSGEGQLSPPSSSPGSGS